MMSMVGVEFTNFMNPNLTWRTVSKGNRSASRRPRKLKARNLKMVVDQVDNSSRVDDTSASESEKLGATVLGQCFDDQIEHVPIKKRKFLFRSPSPPPRSPSPYQEASQKLVSSGSPLGQWSSPTSVSKQRAESIDASTDKFSGCVDDGVVNGKISEVTEGKLGYSEDFSGIEMLVAVACNDSMADGGDIADDDLATDDLLAQRIAASSSTVRSKETVSIIGNSVHEDNLSGSVPLLPTSRDDRTEGKSVSLHVDRAHWDLNTDMDAWGHPCANLVVNSQTNVTDTVSEDVAGYENQEKVEVCKMSKDPGDVAETTIQLMVEKGVSSDAQGGMHVLSDSKILTLGISILNRDETKFCSSPDQTGAPKKYITTSVEPALESSVFAVSYAQTSMQVVSTDVCLEVPSCTGSNCMTATLTSDEIRNSAPSNDIIKQNEDGVSGMRLTLTDSLETTPVEKQNFNLTHAPGPDKASSECIVKQEFDDSEVTSHLHDSKILPRLSTDKCQSPVCHAPNIENSGSKSGKVKTIRECNIKQEFDDSGVTSHLLDSKVLPRLSADKCQSPLYDALDMENPGSKSGKIMNISLPSLMGEDLSVSVASVMEGQPRVTVDATGLDDKALGADRAEVESPASCGQKELVDNSYGYSTDTIGHGSGLASHEQGKSYVNDSPYFLRKVLDSDEFQDGQDHIVGMESMPELQEGYDSQFEDGELRESLVPCLKDIDAEDGEAEQVDYESDDRDMYDINDGDHIVSFGSSMRETSCQPCSGGSLATNLDGEPRKRQSVKPSKLPLKTGTMRKDGFGNPEMDMEVHKGGSADVIEKNEHSFVGDGLKDLSQSESSKSKCSAWDQQPDGVVSSSMTKEIENSNTRRNQLYGCRDGSEAKDVSTRVVRLRDSGRGMPLRGEGPSSFNLLHRNLTARLQQRRSDECDDLCAEDERGPCGSDRVVGRMRSSLRRHGRGRGSQLDHRLGLWKSKHHQFRNYDGPYDSRKPRPKSIVINSDSKVEDAGLSFYPPSKSVYRPFVRRSPTRRDDEYHLHRAIPARDISPDCMRGRSGRYHQRFSPKEGYFRSLPNDSYESFVPMPHNLARRDRSFSPMFPRGDVRFPRPNQRYRSRSRSQSPLLRQLPRDRNAGPRPLSRSPDFRSEARMERMRLPIRKPSFESDYEVDFMSPPRRHYSPKRNNPRWIDDRNRSLDDFRNRRSPPRIFQQSRRFNSPGSPGRLKPDEYFRPSMRAGRFPNMACAGRGHKDGNDDDYRRKPDNRYQMFNSMRRYGTDGGVRRFQYDADGFVAHDSDDNDDCISGIDKKHRDMPRGAKERSFNMWP